MSKIISRDEWYTGTHLRCNIEMPHHMAYNYSKLLGTMYMLGIINKTILDMGFCVIYDSNHINGASVIELTVPMNENDAFKYLTGESDD